MAVYSCGDILYYIMSACCQKKDCCSSEILNVDTTCLRVSKARTQRMPIPVPSSAQM